MNDERKGLPSASSMDADIRCLGRRAIMRHIPKDDGNKWTARGNRIHSVLEGDMHMEELAESDRYTAAVIMNEEARMMDDAHMQGAEITREKRLWGINEDLQQIYSGKFDAVYRLGTKGLLLDYKTGWASHTVPIRNNWQVRTNAALVFANMGIKEIRAAIIHPHHPDGISEETDFTERDLAGFVQDIERYLEQMTEDAPRTPNSISCQYCTAKKICPEYQKQMATVLNADGTLTARPQFETMTPEQRGERLRLLVMVEKSIDEEKEAYKAMLRINAESVAGWFLKPGGTTREIKDDLIAKTLVTQAIGDKVADECMEFSITKLEKHLQARGMSKKDATHYANTLLADQIIKKSKEASLKEKGT